MQSAQEVAYQKASEGFEVAKVAGAMAAEARGVAEGLAIFDSGVDRFEI